MSGIVRYRLVWYGVFGMAGLHTVLFDGAWLGKVWNARLGQVWIGKVGLG